MVLFDLPALTKEDRRKYYRFRKALISQGYRAIQKSVYVKLLSSGRASGGEMLELSRISPPDSKVFALPMSLQQFHRLTALTGQAFDFSFFEDDIIVIGA